MRAAAAVAAAFALAAGAGATAPARAQPATDIYALGVTSALVTLDQERLFEDSAFGRRVDATLAETSRALAAENREIESALIEEERALTEARPNLSPEEFRARADAFDARVTALRTRQENRARALGIWREIEQQRFFEAALPVLSQLLRDIGAVAILDSRAILFALEEADVTGRAIERIDALLGDGEGSALPVYSPQTLPPEPESWATPDFAPPVDRPLQPGGVSGAEGPPVALPEPDAELGPVPSD